MSETKSQQRFLELVKRSRLIEEGGLSEFMQKTKGETGEAFVENQETLAEQMVDAGLLTRWQADKLLAGKHKGFRIGKYKLLKQIGKGGMSSVYLAEHTLMKRPVAIKVLPPNRVGDASYLERFRLEARAVARLDDPNIVRAYDIDSEGKTHYIVMEYVDGDDLHQIVTKNGPLSFEMAADYIAQAALGLQHAHEQGLVHRDIKPANFLVDKKQTVKLLDLGLAKLVEDEFTSLTLLNDENVLGTADYLAPEQAMNSHSADSRADIYSLGCTFYFLLTGRPPFPEGTISQRLLKHQTSTPESIFKSRPDVPPSLVEICERMMAKNPDARIQTAGELATRMSDWLADRGRVIGGGHVDDEGKDSGVGSGIFKRFSTVTPTPPPISSPSSETISLADRDTTEITSEESGSSTLDDIGLAPIDDEDDGVLSDVGSVSDDPATQGEAQGPQADALAKRPVKKSSLFDEVFYDPEAEAIARKVAKRARFNPLQPPGYISPYRSHGIGWWLLVAGIGLLALSVVVWALFRR